jgi:hypothetical protein
MAEMFSKIKKVVISGQEQQFSRKMRITELRIPTNGEPTVQSSENRNLLLDLITSRCDMSTQNRFTEKLSNQIRKKLVLRHQMKPH